MGRSKKKSKKKQGKKSSRRKPVERGYDYGVSSNAAAIGSLEFNVNLQAAEVIGVAYGLAYTNELEMDIPSISLIARNEKPLRLAFEEFSKWSESSDGDAIDMTFVFLRNGAYKLCIGPEPDALVKRVLNYDTIMNPLSFQVTWIKHIDTTSQPLKDLRLHLKCGVRPIIFSGATYEGIVVPGMPPVPEFIRPLQLEKDIIKFDVRFIDEGSDTEHDWQMIALGPESDMAKTKRPSKSRQLPKMMVRNSRITRLKTLFPITLWRSLNCESLIAARRSAENEGLVSWQIDQAICNIVVSREICCGSLHFICVSKSDWPRILIEKLQGRFEIANGKGITEFQISRDEIINQAILDAHMLLKAYGYTSIKKELNATQNHMEKAGLLHQLS